MPRAAPTQPSPSASALASLSTCVGSPVSSARRDRRGKSRHAGMLSGETASPPRAIGPPQPTPHTNSSPRRTAVTSAASRSHIASAPPSPPPSVPPSAPPSRPPLVVVAGVGAASRSRTRPPPSTRPTASLVPPTSTARATGEAPTVVSMECRTLPRRPARPGVSRSAHRVRRDRRNLTWLTHRRREYEAVATSQTAAARGATFSDYYETVLDNIERVIQGKREVIELVLLCLVSEGHLLLEDVPGVGKTNLAKSLATSIECSFGRVQFTPDLLPSDVVGITVWNRGDGSFDFRPGPVFNNIVLADEINRASPKTQAALLEAMAENQVTVDGTTYPLSRPFMVIATQNPIEHEAPTRCPSRNSTGSSCGCRSATRRPTPSWRSSRPTATTTRSSTSARSCPTTRFRAWRRRPGACTWHRASRPTLSTCRRRRAAAHTWRWASRRGPPWRCCAWPRPARPPTVAATSSPTTSRPCRRPCWRTGSSSRRRRSFRASRRPRRSPRSSARSRCPEGTNRMLTRQGWLAVWGGVILAVLARLLGIEELYVFGAVALGLVAFSLLYVRLTRLDVEVDRTVYPARVHAGQVSRVDVRLRNLRRNDTPVLRLRAPA